MKDATQRNIVDSLVVLAFTLMVCAVLTVRLYGRWQAEAFVGGAILLCAIAWGLYRRWKT
jgi:hypothetical protein